MEEKYYILYDKNIYTGEIINRYYTTEYNKCIKWVESESLISGGRGFKEARKDDIPSDIKYI